MPEVKKASYSLVARHLGHVATCAPDLCSEALETRAVLENVLEDLVTQGIKIRSLTTRREVQGPQVLTEAWPNDLMPAPISELEGGETWEVPHEESHIIPIRHTLKFGINSTCEFQRD